MNAINRPTEENLLLLKPRLGNQVVVYQDKHQQIYRVKADFGEFTKEYFVRDVGQRAGILVVNTGSVLLVRQYRLLIDALSWEIPGGKVDDGETFESAAARECLEETGVQCQALKPLLNFHSGLDISHNPTQIFYSEDFIQTGRAHLDPSEVVAYEWVPLERCVQMVFNHQIVDSLTVIAVLAYSTLKGQ